MNVAEEKVTDVGIGGDDLGQSLAVSPESQAVQTRHPDRERRMVHEQIDGSIPGGIDGALQPGQSFLAVCPPALSLLDGVEQEEKSSARLDHRLQEAVLVDRQLGEFVQQPAAVIVIADQKMTRHLEPGQAHLQITVLLRLPVMDQVAGDDA